jgi:hypothetical protein
MTVRPGQVWVPKPDRDLKYQKVVTEVSGGFVTLAPFNEGPVIPARRTRSVSINRLPTQYRLLWHCV